MEQNKKINNLSLKEVENEMKKKADKMNEI
jgi:hypothetical protein